MIPRYTRDDTIHRESMHKHWMQQAIAQAKTAQTQNEVPVGALLVLDNLIIGTGYNQVITKNDPTAHAEIVAIRNACEAVGNYRLEHATLYVTLEPCPMCTAALTQARISRIVFGCRDFKMGACGTVFNLSASPKLNHKIPVDEGVLEGECRELLQEFFANRRG